MPAARGGSRVQAKPRAKPAAKPARRAAAKPQGRALSARAVLAITAGVLVLAAGVTLGTGGRAQQLADGIGAGLGGRAATAGFRLKTVDVQGASVLARPDIVEAAQVYLGQPMLSLDLEEVRAGVRRVGWVKDARIVRLLPDTVVIAVEERRQLAVWQHAGRSRVIDERGQIIPEADPADFATLPLVVGAEGAAHASEILPYLAQRPKLMSRMEALIRVDDRRWDLRLKDGSLIQLPAAEEEHALIQLEQLDQRSRILDLGFERIDLRNPDTVAVRPRVVTATAPNTSPPSGA